MKIRSRLAAAAVVGWSLATCVVAHADSAPVRYGPRDTLVKETEQAATGSMKGQRAHGRSIADRQKQLFASGPRNTIPVQEQKENAMLSHER